MTGKDGENTIGTPDSPAPEGALPWRCFHCGDVFTDEAEARDHFGPDYDVDPACAIKADEGGLVGEIRRLEAENLRLANERNEFEWRASAGAVPEAEALREAVLREALEAVTAEHLVEPLDEADEAYNRAICHARQAIGRLFHRASAVKGTSGGPPSTSERDEFLLRQAQPHVCSLLCPSTRCGDEPWKHHYLCEAITERLARLTT